MVSERKRKANQRNAKGSTGPKNSTTSRYNAQKHGMTSKAAIIQNGAGKEDSAELDSLLEAYWEDLRPDGAVQEGLVDAIVSCVWRKRRALRWEAVVSRAPLRVDALEKILRYGTAIDREKYRALKELSERQAFRRAADNVA